MAGRIFLANVGVNASRRFSSPTFPDRTFEFIPIPEDRELPGPHAVRYKHLRSYQDPAHDLKAFIPERLWDRSTHNDPEFDAFTYGDNCETSPRAAALKHLAEGDCLLFLAHLVEWERPGPRGSVKPNPGGRHGFYLIGYLEIEEVMRDIRRRPTGDAYRRVAANAHVRRVLGVPGLTAVPPVPARRPRYQGFCRPGIHRGRWLTLAVGRRPERSAGDRLLHQELLLRHRPYHPRS